MLLLALKMEERGHEPSTSDAVRLNRYYTRASRRNAVLPTARC